jgi:hypothetical protein
VDPDRWFQFKEQISNADVPWNEPGRAAASTDGEARTDMRRAQLAQARTCLGHPGNRALQNDRPPALSVPHPGLRITCVEDVESQNVTGPRPGHAAQRTCLARARHRLSRKLTIGLPMRSLRNPGFQGTDYATRRKSAQVRKPAKPSGTRARFKSVCPKGREGSNLSSPTYIYVGPGGIRARR